MIDVGGEALGLLDIGEVAALLKLSKVTIRRRIASGDLEAVRVGSRVLIAPEAVVEYKDRLRKAAQAASAEKSAA